LDAWFAYLRDAKAELGLGDYGLRNADVFGALRTDHVSLAARVLHGPSIRIVDFVIQGLGRRVPESESRSHLTRYPLFSFLAPHELFPSHWTDGLGDEVVRAVRDQLGTQPAAGLAEVIIGQDTRIPTVPAAYERYQWDPDQPSRPYAMTVPGEHQITDPQYAALTAAARRAHDGRKQKRGRPRGTTKYSADDLSREARALKRELGFFPSEERLAQELGIDPDTVHNTLTPPNGPYEDYHDFRQNESRIVRGPHIIRR
jgi:hypothetical protein